jgi:hypothetical protein
MSIGRKASSPPAPHFEHLTYAICLSDQTNAIADWVSFRIGSSQVSHVSVITAHMPTPNASHVHRLFASEKVKHVMPIVLCSALSRDNG